jgi:hypothetical protein
MVPNQLKNQDHIKKLKRYVKISAIVFVACLIGSPFSEKLQIIAWLSLFATIFYSICLGSASKKGGAVPGTPDRSSQKFADVAIIASISIFVILALLIYAIISSGTHG